MKKVVSGESGRVLVWTLVILGIGTLLIPPLLDGVSANLFATRAVEESLKEQYAADAGVEQAIFMMSTGDYTLGESFDPPPLVNNLLVSVTISAVPDAPDVYKIVSEAEDTRIESYVSAESTNLLWLLDNAITSAGDVELSPNSVVDGDIRYVGELKGSGTIGEGFTAEVDPSIADNWPSADDIADFYWMDVYDLDPHPGDSFDVESGTEAEPYVLGPLYRDGDLDINSSKKDAVAKLNGTIYVTGQLNIGGTDKDFTLDLNNQTIYVEYTGNGDAIYIGGKAILAGSGCIIAEGDIFFAPNAVVAGPDDFILIMSVTGESQINPGGSFYGTVAGDTMVDLQPGVEFGWTSPYGRGLNFPTGSKGFLEFVTYHIY